MASDETKDRFVDAFLALLAEKRFSDIGLDAIAVRAGLSLGDLRDAFDGKIAILAAFIRRLDTTLLRGRTLDAGDESKRDRLFDLMMARFDQLTPYRAAFGNLESSVRRDPALALCLNHIALDSARFALASVGSSSGGLLGAARAQGLVTIMARVLPVWQSETDPDLSRTMAALDKALERAEDWSRRAERAKGFACGIARRFERSRPRAATTPSPVEPAAEAGVA